MVICGNSGWHINPATLAVPCHQGLKPATNGMPQNTMERLFTFTQQRIYKMAGGRVIDNRIRKTGSIVAYEGVTRVLPPLNIFANRCFRSGTVENEARNIL